MTTPKTVSLEQFLIFSASLVRTYGYVPSKVAKESGKPSTGELAWKWATEGRTDDLLKSLVITPEDKATGRGTFEWMKKLYEKNQKNDYLNNLAAIGYDGQVSKRTIGYAASAIQVWQKEFTASLVKTGEFLGVEGQKLTVKVKFISTIKYFSQYGEGYIHKFEDDNGNLITWSTGNDLNFLNMKENDLFVVSGKIKKHSEYKGTRQTEITRAAVMRR